jgi:hypothetical protein
MAGIFAFKCSSCDAIHEGSPSFAFRAPDPWLGQPKEIQDRGSLGTDHCRYQDSEGEHFFVRACLEVPIVGIEVPFLWGVWGSLSEKNYRSYFDKYDDPDPTDRYFSWFSNVLPYYQTTVALRAEMRPRKEGLRPLLNLGESVHPLAIDFHRGISIAKAQEIAEAALHPSGRERS